MCNAVMLQEGSFDSTHLTPLVLRLCLCPPLCHRFETQKNINVFETTIRIVGGLLAAYEMTHLNVFLENADLVASGMMYAYNR